MCCSLHYYDTSPIDKQADRSWSACLSFLSETCASAGHGSFARGQASRAIEVLLACLFCLKGPASPCVVVVKVKQRYMGRIQIYLTYDAYCYTLIDTLLITIGGHNYAK